MKIWRNHGLMQDYRERLEMRVLGNFCGSLCHSLCMMTSGENGDAVTWLPRE